jgi:hypothetical protein
MYQSGAAAMMSAEELKRVVREYAEQEFGPRWDAASVMVTLPATGRAETLVVLRDPRPPAQRDDPPPSD